MKLMQEYDARLIVSGNMLEVYLYDKIQTKKETIDENEKEIDQSKENENEESTGSDLTETVYKRKRQSAQRSKKKLERLVFANVGQYEEKDKFITLTFKKDVNRSEVLKKFKDFIRRLKRKCGNVFEYIAVIERGGKGKRKLHLHCVFFNLPYIKNKELRKIWGNGFVKINAFSDENEITRYIIKYVEKTLTEDNYIGKGKKFYFTSQHLKKPEEIYCSAIEAVRILNGYEKINPEKLPLCDFEYDSPYVGKFRYLKINDPVKKEIVLTDEEIEYYSDMMKDII